MFAGKKRHLEATFLVLLFCGWSLLGTAQVSLHFAGDDDRVTGINASLPQGNASRTIEAWVKYSTGNDMSIFNYGTFSANQKFTLHLYNGVYIIGEGNDLATGFAVNDGNWHHVAVTHDGTTTKVYVDGTVRGTRNTTYNTTGTNFEIGANLRNGYQFHYNGNVDNVRVWDVARTQQQIQDNMFSHIASASNLIASFDFEEGEPNGNNTAITTLIDATGTANGTLNNFTLTGTSSNYVDGTVAIAYDSNCPSSTTWNGTSWSNGVPDDQTNAVINGNLTVSGPLEMCGAVVLENKTLTIGPSGSLTVFGEISNAGTVLVKADATGIGSLITEGAITGNGSFQMEQYLTGAGAPSAPTGAFYYVGSPVVDATAASYDIASGNKLWSADEVAQSYPQITNDATVLNPTQGYVARMGATGSITFNGTSFNTGNQNASGLTRTGAIAANRGYNLVGNPYPSSVNWDDAVKSNVGTTIWYRTHNVGGVMTYDTYNESGPGIGTNNNFTGNDVTGIIAPGQGFWVRVVDGQTSGSVSFTNAMRSHGALAGIYKQETEEGIVRFNLSNGTVSDETILHFNAEALDGYDAYDSEKMWASNIPQLYTTIGADSLTINGLYSTATNPIVDLGVKLPSSGNYTLNANDITIVGETAHLEDRLLNIFQDLNVEPNYSFTSTAGNIGDRFALHFGMSVTGIGTDAMQGVSTRVYTSNGNTLNIILSENTESGKMDVMDMAGRIVGSFNLNTNRTTLEMNVNAGIYLVRIETENGIDTYRTLLD